MAMKKLAQEGAGEDVSIQQQLTSMTALHALFTPVRRPLPFFLLARSICALFLLLLPPCVCL